MSRPHRALNGLWLKLSPLFCAILACAGCGGTSIVTNCDSPRASIISDVVLVVMPYEYPGEKRQLSADASDLALFTQLQMLRSGLGYNSFGVTLLLPSRNSAMVCDAVDVEDKLTGRKPNPDGSRIVPSSQDLIIWRGRVFEEDGALYVQNHVRLVDRADRRFVHRKRVADIKEPFDFSGSLPIRSITFPARKVTPETLKAWQAALASAAEVRDEPDAGASKVVGKLRHDSPAQYKLEPGATPREADWARIRQADGTTGWIRIADAAAESSLLPDLRFMEGLVAFLQYYHPQPGLPQRDHIVKITRAFEAYRASETSPYARGALLASALLQGYAELNYGSTYDDATRVSRARESFDRVAKELPLNSQVRTLTVLPRIISCCQSEAQQMEIERALIMAIVADPTNDVAARNLENYYEYLVRARVPGPFDRATVNERQRQLRGFREATAEKKK